MKMKRKVYKVCVEAIPSGLPWLIAAFLLAAALWAPPAQGKEAILPASFAELAKKASPSVVNISAVKVVKTGPGIFQFGAPPGANDPFRDFFERFFGDRMPREFKQRSLGSGFLIDQEGHILTNNHVVEQTEEIEVTLSEDETYSARIVGRDPKTDLALIRIESDKKLKPMPLGDSDSLEVGDWVVAIGSPFGLGHTVTAGIVSAKYRRIGAGAYDDFIQTDASINPGNSGGPLLNTEGEVVGINTAIFSQSGGNIGIGFAIPVNMAKKLLPQLKEGKVIRGWLGVMIQEITPSLKDKLGLETTEGALVADVTAGSPADKAGIRRGDVIVSFDGKKIIEMNDLPFLVATTPVGKEVVVEIIRKGEKKRLEVQVGELEEEAETTVPAESEAAPDLGMTLQEITPELARQYGLSEQSGLVVAGIERGGPAMLAGLRAGDIILEVDQMPVRSLREFQSKIRSYKEGETVLLLVKRKDRTLFLTLEIP